MSENLSTRPSESTQEDVASEPNEPLVSELLMEELVRLRKKRKIGQQPIADSMGISQARVSQMENLKGGLALEAVMGYARAIGAKIIVNVEKPRKADANDPPE